MFGVSSVDSSIVRFGFNKQTPPKNNSQKILSLAPEMFGHVVKFLPFEDQFTCQKVCKTWNKYFADPKCREEMGINSLWRSHKACEFLIDKLIPKDQKEKEHTRHVAIGKSKLSAKTVAYVLINGSVLYSAFKYANNVVNDWYAHPADERIQLMNQVNEEIRKGIQDWYDMDHDVMRRPREYLNLEQFDSENTRGVNSLCKAVPAVFTSVVQSNNGCNHSEEVRQLTNRAPDEVNNKIVNTLSYPKNLLEDPELNEYECNISETVPLIPVFDKCGHFFDFLAIKHHIKETIKCPIGGQSLTMDDLTFSREAFLMIQERLKALKQNRSPLVSNIPFKIFNLSKLETENIKIK